MTLFQYNTRQLKHNARWVLVLFVVSVMNMAFQVPVHAAMQQAMQAAPGMDHGNMSHHGMNHGDMNHGDMDHGMMHHSDADQGTTQKMGSDECCPPSLCDSVEAQQDQLSPSSVTPVSAAFEQIIPVLVLTLQDTQAQLSHLGFAHTNWQYRQVSPPPIQFTTELQI